MLSNYHFFIVQQIRIREAHESIRLLLSQNIVEDITGAGRLALLNLLLAELLLGVGGGVGVETEHDLLVAERVLLLDNTTLGAGLTLGGAEDGLDFRRVDEAGQIGVGNVVGGQEEVLLESRGSGGGTVDLVESLESGGGPDDEATDVATGGELEEVEGEDGGCLDTGDVAEGLDEVLAVGLGVVDNQRTAALAEAAVTELTLTGTHLLGLLDLDELVTGTEGLEEGDGGLGLGQSTTEGLGLNNEGNLGDLGDAVATGEQEGGDGRGSQSRGGSKALLVQVDLLVPLAPHLGGSEHTTGTALVTEGSLTGTVSTTTGDTGNTGDSTACWISNDLVSVLLCQLRCFRHENPSFSMESSISKRFHPISKNFRSPRTGTPGLSGGLLAGLLADGVRLALVLGHADVHLPVEEVSSAFPPPKCPSSMRVGVLDNVRADGRREDGGEGLGGPGGLALSRSDRNGRTRRHCCRSMSMVRLKTKRFPVGAYLWIFSLTELPSSWVREALSPRYPIGTSVALAARMDCIM